jgi:hypothetical protein
LDAVIDLVKRISIKIHEEKTEGHGDCNGHTCSHHAEVEVNDKVPSHWNVETCAKKHDNNGGVCNSLNSKVSSQVVNMRK